MPEPITRRRFLRDAALVSGAAVLVDPRVVLGAGPAREGARARPAPREDGGAPARVTELDFARSGDPFWIRGRRFGSDYSVELDAEEVRYFAPTRSAQVPAVVSLADFEVGRGHDEIAQLFGPEALHQLRLRASLLRS